MKTRKEIKTLAREALRERRGTAILLGLVYCVLTAIWTSVYTKLFLVSAAMARRSTGILLSGTFLGTVVFVKGLAVLLVMAVLLYGAFLKLYKREDVSVEAMFTGLRPGFFRKLGGIAWMMLWLGLWSLLFVIPGVVKLFSYFAAPFILAEYPDVKAREALTLSKRMTKGHRGQVFVMMLSFFGWGVLSVLTLGILGIVFVLPYFYLTYAGYYAELRDLAIADGVIDPAELGIE